MNRSVDWLHQAQADLAQAELGAATGGDRMARELRSDLRWLG